MKHIQWMDLGEIVVSAGSVTYMQKGKQHLTSIMMIGQILTVLQELLLLYLCGQVRRYWKYRICNTCSIVINLTVNVHDIYSTELM